MTHVGIGLRHETGHDAMLDTSGLSQQLEENSVVGNSKGGSIGQGGFKDTWSSFSVCNGLIQCERNDR